MTNFKATVNSEADISADREAVWKTLTDPVVLPKLTPLLRSIDADGDTWTWHMMRIGGLGVTIRPTFTEEMTFDEGKRIAYTHKAPQGVRERAGAEGVYMLSDVDGGTHLEIELTICVDLPLPAASSRAVEKVMRATIARTGEKFSENLLEHLGAREL